MLPPLSLPVCRCLEACYHNHPCNNDAVLPSAASVPPPPPPNASCGCSANDPFALLPTAAYTGACGDHPTGNRFAFSASKGNVTFLTGAFCFDGNTPVRGCVPFDGAAQLLRCRWRDGSRDHLLSWCDQWW